MASGVFLAKQIKAKRFRPQTIANEIRNALRSERRLLVQDFEAVVEHWQGDRPDFGVTTQVAPTRSDEIAIFVGPTGDDFAVKKFMWLDLGTSVRYYAMSEDFVAKTHPDSLSTNPGETGSPYYAGGLQLNGIEARNFSKLIREKREKGFKKRVWQAFQRGLAKSKSS